MLLAIHHYSILYYVTYSIIILCFIAFFITLFSGELRNWCVRITHTILTKHTQHDRKPEINKRAARETAAHL